MFSCFLLSQTTAPKMPAAFPLLKAAARGTMAGGQEVRCFGKVGVRLLHLQHVSDFV